ncbi:hypothetical protein GF324_13580, partial [bacterium]|nr:hypothetical protein [bacterium]
MGLRHNQRQTIIACLVLSLIATISCRQNWNHVHLREISPRSPLPEQSNITFKFSRDVVTPGRIDQRFDSAAVRIEPAHPGWFRWLDTRTLQLMPTEPFKPSTSYQINFDESLVELPEVQMAGVQTVEVKTRRFSLLGVHTDLEPIPDDPSRSFLELRLQFSDIVSPDELRKHVEIRRKDSGDSIGYTIQNIMPSREFVLLSEPIERLLKEDVELQIRVDKDLKPVEGNLPLGKTEVKTVTLDKQGTLKVDNVQPMQHDKSFVIQITLSVPVDAVDARDYIKLEPSGEFDVTTGYSNQLILTGEFQQRENVKLTLLEGLPSLNGKTLEKTFTQQVNFPELQPSVEFASHGSYLARSGLKNVQLDVVNLDFIRVEVTKIYRNNMVHFLHDRGAQRGHGTGPYGRTIYNEQVRIEMPGAGDLPVPVPVTVNFDPFLREHSTGLFVMTVRDDNRYWRNDARVILLTDIGMIAKMNGDALHVWTLSTSTNESIAGVSLELLSENNQSMGQAVTDASGHAVIGNLGRFADEFSPYVITASRGEDFSYLEFDNNLIHNTHFDVGGRTISERGFDAWMYGPRDIYRPGETAHIAAVVRAVEGAVPPGMPVTLRINDPAGREWPTQKGRVNEEGMVDFLVEIPVYARTGRYSATLHTSGDHAHGRYSFQVEEFIPDRIKVELETNGGTFTVGDSLRMDVTGTMLFGPPAQGRRCTGQLTLSDQSFSPEKWQGYRFGDPDKSFDRVTETLGETELDDEGRASFTWMVPDHLRPSSTLRAHLQTVVYEKGGRTVAAHQTVTIHPYSHYIGLRRQNEQGYATPGNKETFDLVLVTPDGELYRQSRKLSLRYVRYRWQSTLQRDRRGQYRYQSRRVAQTLSRDQVVYGGKTAQFSFSPQTYGQYGVEVEDSETGVRTVYTFYAGGWGYNPWAMQHPDRIELELDRERYGSGQSANVLVKAPFSGMLLLTVERDKVFDQRLVRMTENTAEIAVPLRRAFEPNVYITATLVRSGADVDPSAPMRAYGAVPVMMDMSRYRMDLSLDVPRQIRPRTTLDVTLHAPGVSGPATVTVAAVDEGILQLNDFKTPDPHKHFYGKQQLNVRTYDIFQRLLPEAEQAMIHSRPGGGKSAGEMGHVSSLSQA